MFETIETPRLLLRKLTPEVYEYVFTRYSQDELLTFWGYTSQDALDTERRRYEAGVQMYGKSLLMFHLIEKETQQVIGWCGYHTWYTQHNRAELGYVLTDDAAKGKRYMSEALPVVLRYGFDTMQLHRVEAFIGVDNEASIKLVKRHGFVQEGCLREHYCVNGVNEDSLVFGLLQHEYQDKP